MTDVDDLVLELMFVEVSGAHSVVASALNIKSVCHTVLATECGGEWVVRETDFALRRAV